MSVINRVIILAVAFTTLTPLTSAQSPSPARSVSGDEPDVVRVDTRLVTVPVTVRGRGGEYVTGLTREDFRIHEDGVEQQVAHFEPVSQPIHIILLMDYSVSVRADLGDIREIAAGFLHQLRTDDQVRAVAFGHDITVLFGDSRDRPSLRQAILGAPMQGGTALYDAVLFTFRHLIQPGGGRKAIILFTDGVDTASHRGSFEKSLAYAEELDAPVHVAKYGAMETERERQGSHYLQRLAAKSGGRFHFAGGKGSIRRALSSIAEELRAQYSLGYYPAVADRRGRRRKIKVRVSRPNVAVRARGSYIVGGVNGQ